MGKYGQYIMDKVMTGFIFFYTRQPFGERPFNVPLINT